MPLGAAKAALLAAAGSGSDTSAFEVISTSTSQSSSLTFSSIPQTFKHLRLVTFVPGGTANNGNYYLYGVNSGVNNSRATIYWQAGSGIYKNGYNIVAGDGFRTDVGGSSVTPNSSMGRYFISTWLYYSDAAGSGTSTRWSSAQSEYVIIKQTGGNAWMGLSNYNEYGADSNAAQPVTSVNREFSVSSESLPSGTTTTLYGFGGD